MKFIIAIDPGNHTGITYGFENTIPTTELHDFTPKAGTRGTVKKQGRKAEEKHVRYGKLFLLLQTRTNPNDEIVVICEGAAGFTKGKAAVEVSNKYRGVVEAFASINNYTYIGIQPNDLQRWATGKGRAEKSEMLAVAAAKYGYKGNDDNEGDSVLLWHFARMQHVIVDTQSQQVHPTKPFHPFQTIVHNADDVNLAYVERVPISEKLKPAGEETQKRWLDWQNIHSQVLKSEK